MRPKNAGFNDWKGVKAVLADLLKEGDDQNLKESLPRSVEARGKTLGN